MGNDFMSQLENTLVESTLNRSITENGAVGYKTTGRKLVDLNFAVSSLRNKSESEIQSMFESALAQDVDTAIVWLFFARDIRGGLGERRTFRVCLKLLAREFPQKLRKVIHLVPEYGRWDDLLCLMETKVQSDVVSLIGKQLKDDINNMKSGKSISLLAKWLPSMNASSDETRRMGMLIASKLKLNRIDYQNLLSKMRKYLEIVERKMSACKWDEINYEHVPSRANLNYNNAFLRHDEGRRREYLGKLEKGTAKINSSVLFPHDIVHKYMNGGCRGVHSEDPAIEAMWKALPNTVKDGEGTIVVADGSGSMMARIGDTNISALEVANALAIYFAERLSGPYKDKYITFSARPQLVNLAGSTTLNGKLRTACKHDEVADTNIKAVFNLILSTAIQNHLSQDQLPKNILIISDMEFDSCAMYGSRRMNSTLFKEIEKKYNQYGYNLPRLVFWNVCSRTGTIPVKENGMGVALVSGFSPNVAKMVMSGALDPMGALLETLGSQRYRPVWDALGFSRENLTA